MAVRDKRTTPGLESFSELALDCPDDHKLHGSHFRATTVCTAMEADPMLLCNRMAQCVLQSAANLQVVLHSTPEDLLNLGLGQTVRHEPLIPEFVELLYNSTAVHQ